MILLWQRHPMIDVRTLFCIFLNFRVIHFTMTSDDIQFKFTIQINARSEAVMSSKFDS